VTAPRLGLRANLPQFALMVGLNAFVRDMITQLLVRGDAIGYFVRSKGGDDVARVIDARPGEECRRHVPAGERARERRLRQRRTRREKLGEERQHQRPGDHHEQRTQQEQDHEACHQCATPFHDRHLPERCSTQPSRTVPERGIPPYPRPVAPRGAELSQRRR